MSGQLRIFLLALSAVLVIVVGAIVLILLAPERQVGTGAQAGLELDIPDTDRDLAEALMVRAEQELNLGDSRAARESYDRARSQYRQLGDVLGEASVAFGLARLEHFTGQSDRARANYSEAVSLFLRGGSAMDQARVLAALGDLEKDTFNWGVARQHYRDARTQWLRAPGPKSDPHVLLGIERLADMPQGEEHARDQLEQALKLYFQVEDGIGKGDVAMILGNLEFNLRSLDAARSKLADARAIYQGTDARHKEAQANLSLAIIELHRGHNLDVAEALGFAAILYVQANDLAGAQQVALARGRLAMMEGRWQAAEDIYTQAAADLDALSHRREPDALMGLGDARAMLGNLAGAASAYGDASELYRRFGIDTGEARALAGLGQMAIERGQTRAARERLVAAGALFAKTGETLAAARTLITFGSVLQDLNDEGGALQMFQEAAPMFEREAVPVGKILAALGTGDVNRGLNKNGDAAEAYAQASEWFAAVEFPVAEANRFLGLPAVESIGIRIVGDGRDPYQMAALGQAAPGGETAGHDVQQAENLAAFPNQNARARVLISALEARIAEAMEFVNSLN